MTDEIEIEVLQHGGNHHENHVLSHEGKEQMRPSEVIVLYVEVLFACSTLIIKCNLLTCYVCSTKIGEFLTYPSVLRTLFLRRLEFSQEFMLRN